MNELSVALLVVALAVIVALALRLFQITTQLDARVLAQTNKAVEEWRRNEFDVIRRQQEEVARSIFQAQLEDWKRKETADIRKKAIEQSRRVIIGKSSENLAPYFGEFAFNPSDARFLGSPIDFIVFDGLDENALRSVIFVEVKTGASQLSARERQVRDAINAKRVKWEEIRIGLDSSSPLLTQFAVEASDGKAGPGAALESEHSSWMVMTEDCPVYASPDAQSREITILNDGDAFTVTAEVDGTDGLTYYRLRLPDGRIGYVEYELLEDA